ncbi:MAG: MFS transporter [Lachnospiraceae bacterium]
MKTKSNLWTKDFTIITAGTVVSLLGNSIAGFAMGLLVLDLTGSTLLYALYMFLYTAPRIIMPIISGPLLDKFSRKKAIYMLDFLSAAMYALFAAVLFFGEFQFWILAVGCVVLGCVDSVYRVAYDSFYPMLITEGNYSKAYSVSSVLETLTAVMVPVSAVLYNTIGIAPLFLANAISFFIAAVMETRIEKKEEYTETRTERFTLNRYKKDFMEGVNYLKAEKGLWAITLYFAFSSMAGAASGVIGLPYFKSAFAPHGEYVFICVWGCAIIGRMIGGSIYYKFKWPASKKFSIALFVYAATCLIEGTYLFTPVKVMMVLCFLSGVLGVTSYNIRISATQSYVPDERKGRFNGMFEMMMTLGAMIGQLTSGAMTVVVRERIVLSIFMGINFLAALWIIGRNKSHVAPIYNRHA